MPTYQYACTACAERLEVVQRFSDDPLTVCPSCAGTLRKVFYPVGVVFKGSGFYKTDSRSSSSSSSSSAAAPASSSGSDSSGASSGSGSDSSGASSGASSGSSSGPAEKKAAAPAPSSTATPKAAAG